MADSRGKEPTRQPFPSERFEMRRVGEARTDGATLYLWKQVLDELVFAARYRPEETQAGVLLGSAGQGPASAFVEVKGYAELSPYADSQAFLREMLDDWEMTRNRLERAHPDMEMVGWVSIRPEGRARPSHEELMTHRTFFNLPHQILVSVDGVTEELGVYGLDEDGYLINLGFTVVERR